MGHVVHHAIVVTGGAKDRAIAAYNKALELDLRPSPIMESNVNGDFSFMIGPDGSKTGWPENALGHERRTKFKAWCRAQRKARALYVHWVEIVYGPDLFDLPHVTDCSENHKEE